MIILVMVEVIINLVVGGEHGGTHGGLADIEQLGLQLLYRELRNLVRSGDLVTELGLENILDIRSGKIFSIFDRENYFKHSIGKNILGIRRKYFEHYCPTYFLRQIVFHEFLEDVRFLWRWRW